MNIEFKAHDISGIPYWKVRHKGYTGYYRAMGDNVVCATMTTLRHNPHQINREMEEALHDQLEPNGWEVI